MKSLPFFRMLLPFCGIVILVSCAQEQKNQTTETTPEVFTPVDRQEDSVAENAVGSVASPESDSPKTVNRKLPTRAQLQTITPNQEAKRALTTDAMKAAEMGLTEFGDFMKGRIPYYKGKGELKFENDIVKIHITKTEMHLQTPKGTLTFPMQ